MSNEEVERWMRSAGKFLVKNMGQQKTIFGDFDEMLRLTSNKVLSITITKSQFRACLDALEYPLTHSTLPF